MAQGSKVFGITGAIGLVILVVLTFVLVRSCHQGNDPQSTDDVEELESGWLLLAPLEAAAAKFVSA